MAAHEQMAQDELLYRQVGPGGDPIYFAPDRVPPVHRSLFLPGKADTDGLSMIRSRYRTPIWAAYRVEQPETRFRLANLPASRLEDFGQTVGFEEFAIEATSDALDEQHGEPIAHCVARQINRGDYDASRTVKKQIKEWALKVADSIEMADVHGPYPKPTDENVYRP